MKNQEKVFVEELIRVIRPANKNHIFNEEYEIIQVYGQDEIKTVILREKQK